MKTLYLATCLSVLTMAASGGLSQEAFTKSRATAAPITPATTQPVNNQLGVSTTLTKVDAQGYVYNNSNICVARIDASGAIYDGNNKNLGKIYKNGYVYNAKNDNLGSVDSKGNIYNQQHVFIGKVDKKGNVFTSDNNQVGQVAKDRKTTALLLLLNGNSLFDQ